MSRMSTADQVENISEHFSKVASAYHLNILFQSPHSSYGKWISRLILDELDLKSGHILADVGCGSGIDSLSLLEQTNNQIHIIASDPSSGMINILNEEIKNLGVNHLVKAYCQDAVAFSHNKSIHSYNRLLMKYCIHLLTHDERLEAFKGFQQQLDPTDNKFVIVARAGKEIFPFDERTQHLYLSATPPIEVYAKELSDCGFTNIKFRTHQFEFDKSVKLQDWIDVIENRTWSTFSNDKMNDEQLTALVQYLRSKYETEPFCLRDEVSILQCTRP